MTIVNWERYETLPLRNRDKVEACCRYLGLSFDQISEKFQWKGKVLG